LRPHHALSYDYLHDLCSMSKERIYLFVDGAADNCELIEELVLQRLVGYRHPADNMLQ
jgi:hypothetical protein